jgi:dihydrolipoamide dehydrogenase
MQNLDVDVAIIGTGTAGLAAYRAARVHHKRVVLVEGGPYGTTCARVGCMPSKLLIAAADSAHAVAAAPGFGVHPGPLRIDGPAVMARVRVERDRFVGFVLDGVNALPNEDKLRGHARFTSATSLQVDQHTSIKAGSVVIATGSTPVLPPALRGGLPGVITSDDVFEWTDLPASVAVIGSGIIGLELGQALARLGVQVTIYARSGSVAQLTDRDVVAAAAKTLALELDLRFHHSVLAAEQDGAQVILTVCDAAGAIKSARFDKVLVAAGRSPNVADIGIETTGLALDDDGIPQFDGSTMQCGSSAIFIAGDANNERPVLPEAADQGRIAGDNAARFPDVQPGLRRTPLAIAFTEPNIATVGTSFEALSRAGMPPFSIGSVSFENQGRSRVMLQNHGMLRVYGEHGTGRFLGAELVGPRAEHLAHLLAWACQSRMTVKQMLDLPYYHPVVEEGVRTALRELDAATEYSVHDIAECPDCTPGT